MDVVNDLLLILGGILAVSGLILARKPDAKRLIDQLAPYQALIGVALVAFGAINGLRILPTIADSFKVNLLSAAVGLTVVIVSILLGALFGMPQIAKWIPGDSSAEQKALELTQKIAPFQVLLGLVGLAAAFLALLYRFHIITAHA